MVSEKLGDAYVSIGVDPKALESGLAAAKKSSEDAANGIGKTIGERISGGFSKEMNAGKGKFGDVGKDLGQSVTQGLEQRFGAVGGLAGSLATALGPIGIAGMAAGAAIAGGFVLAVNAARAWETGMAGVSKTSGLTGADLAGLSGKLLDMSTRMPTVASDMQAIAAVAGSLGVGAGKSAAEATELIAGFTEVTAMMAVGFEMSAEVAATSAAKILTSFGKPIDTKNMMALGNVVNSMGDNFAATEPQVLDFINRASFLNTTMGQSIPQVAALGTTLISVGMDAEVAATGIKSALNMGLSETSKTGGIANWAKLMGTSIDELKGKLSTDLGGTMVETANKIAAMEDPVARFQTAVALFGSEGAPAVLKLAGQADILKKALTTANSEWTSGSSLMKTYETQSGTLNSKFSILSNTLNMIGVSVGTPMLPWVSGAVQALQSLVMVAFNAGAAIVGIVKNSSAFAALESAIGNIGNVVSTTFGNFVSLVKPAWDALGGGSAVMGVLQAAFNAATVPITALFTVLSTVASILGKVATAVSPVASAIGGALGTAIKTTSAYVTAFIEAFSNLGPIKALGEAVKGAADIAGKVWDGLSTAVPRAFSGAFEAVKTLITGFISWVGDALGVGDIGTKITDGIKTSLGEGITGWIGSISGRANELLGAGEDIAKPVAEGVKTDEELQKAAAEALNTPEALAAAEKAGGKIADKTLSGFAQQAAMSNLTDLQLLGMINSQDDDSKIKEYVYDLKGKIVKYWYDAASNGPRIAKLSIDDVFMTSGQQEWLNGEAVGYAPTAEQLLKKIGLSDKIISQMKPLAQAKVSKAVTDIKKMFEDETKGIFDSAPATKNIAVFAPELEGELKSLMDSVSGNIAAYGKPKMVAAGQAFLDGLAEPFSLSGMGNVISALGKLKTEMGKGTENIFEVNKANQMVEKYKAALVAGISDMGPYVGQEMSRIGTDAAAAIEDGFLSIDDKALLDSLLAQAKVLKEVAPAEYEAVGGDLVVALVTGIKEGDIAGPAAAKATEGIDAIKKTLSEGASIENFGALGEQYYNLAQAMGSRWTAGMQAEADASMAQYKELLSGAITDIGAFTADAMELAGSTASAAFSDNVFTKDDLVKLQTNLLPMLEMVEETSPEYFESAAGKAWLAFEEAIKSGDPDEIYKKFKELGTGAGDGFLAGVKKSVSLKEIYNLLKADPKKLKTLISDPVKFAWTDGIDGAKKAIDAERDELSTGLIDAATARENILNAFSPLKDVLPGWVNGLTEKLATGEITLGQYLSQFEKNYKVLEDYRKKTEESTTATEKSTKATKEKTAALDENKLSLKSLNDEIKTTKELSGAGLTITFSPARVIAEEAKNALVLGAQIASGFITGGGNAVKIGFDQWGREVAVIGRVAQEKWARNGELISANIKKSSDSAATTTKTAATDAKGIQIAGVTEGNVLFLKNIKDVNVENKNAVDYFSGAVTGASVAISGAGAVLKNAADLGSTKFKLDVGAAASDHSLKVKSSITDWVTRYSIASTNEQSKLITTGAGVRGSLTAGGNSIFNSAVAGGNSLLSGANSGATALRNAASAIGSVMDRYRRYDPWNYYATGTKTSGPQMAVIGEDGPANPEYVIPTKTKRWDLLAAVNRDYGIPGFAEGTSTGGSTVGGEGEAPPMSATFGIVGLAGMAKQVKKIITDLKDFFRISWGIVKAEGSTYWKQINTVITTEATAIRDTGWQAALDIRNAWLEMSKTITDDAKASWEAYWPAIEPTINSLKESLIGAFTDAGSGMKEAIDSMVLNSEDSLRTFESAWAEIWAQLVTDMTDAQAKISEGVAQIAAELQKISVNVNISVGGGGYGGGGGGGFPGDWGFGSEEDWLAPTGDWADTWSDYGNVCGQNFNQAVQDSIMPLDDRYTGGGGGYGSWGSYTPSYQPVSMTSPYYMFAKGALVEKPTEAIIGEAGPEMVLPAKLTRMFVSLADIGLGSSGGTAKDKIVIEDRTEHHWYMDGKEVTNVIMDRVMKQLQLRGAVPAK